MPTIHCITPYLWFDGQAEAAAAFYTAIFPNSKITTRTRYGEAGKETHGQLPGTIMTVAFELDGQSFTALNGGSQFQFNEAISFQISCETQDQMDYLWNKLSADGDPNAQVCGWLKDKYGISWQVVPNALAGMLVDSDTAKSERVMAALLKMKKINLAELQRAYKGDRQSPT